jgi:hypothetical protein
MSALLLQSKPPIPRVVVVGGGDDSTQNTLQMIDLSKNSPSWEAPVGIPDGKRRMNGSIVLLPDGSVFLCGGLNAPPYPCWQYKPFEKIGNRWHEMDESAARRQYHSVALLLPSGKVMVTGGAMQNGCTGSVENVIEVFTPPYLFERNGSLAARPRIVTINGSAPPSDDSSVLHYGAQFTIEHINASDIAKVVLVRPMAVTHQTDTEQRVVDCQILDQKLSTTTAIIPKPLHTIVPAGYYMLFILSANGVPSEGKFVHVE